MSPTFATSCSEPCLDEAVLRLRPADVPPRRETVPADRRLHPLRLLRLLRRFPEHNIDRRPSERLMSCGALFEPHRPMRPILGPGVRSAGREMASCWQGCAAEGPLRRASTTQGRIRSLRPLRSLRHESPRDATQQVDDCGSTTARRSCADAGHTRFCTILRPRRHTAAPAFFVLATFPTLPTSATSKPSSNGPRRFASNGRPVESRRRRRHAEALRGDEGGRCEAGRRWLHLLRLLRCLRRLRCRPSRPYGMLPRAVRHASETISPRAFP